VERERLEHRREPVDAPHADGAERVAVVGLADGHEPRPLRPRRIGLHPELEGHLQGRLDGARPVAREEHLLQAGWGDLDEPPGERDGGGIGEAEVRRVGHLRRLGCEGRIEPRVPVAVHRAPHARRAVEIPSPFRVDEPRPLAPLDEERLVLTHLRERVPHVLAIPGPEPVLLWRRGVVLARREVGIRRTAC